MFIVLLIIFLFICHLEIENLKVIKNQNLSFKTSDVQHFTTALFETETITLLELPSLSQFINDVSDVQIKVSIMMFI